MMAASADKFWSAKRAIEKEGSIWSQRIGAYVADDSWHAIAAKAAVVIYMFIPAYYLFITCEPRYVYFEYLTVWGWTAIHFYFAYCLCLDIRTKVLRRRNERRRASLSNGAEREMKKDIIAEAEISVVARTIAQGLSELCFAVSVVITSLFWFVIYPQERWRSVLFEMQMHGVGLTFMIIDYLYRYTGFHMRNHGYIVGFGCVYMLIHVALVKLRGKPIYPGMDFTGPYSFVVAIIGISTMVATHKLIYLYHHWSRVHQRVKSAVGITQFLVLPRQDSRQLLSWDEQEEEIQEMVRETGGQEPLQGRRRRDDDDSNHFTSNSTVASHAGETAGNAALRNLKATTTGEAA